MVEAPRAPKRPKEITQHGQPRVDHYFWMRYREDPEVLKYLHAESAYLEEAARHLRPLQERLFEEMKGCIQEDDRSAPERYGDYYFYSRSEAGRQYPVYCRAAVSGWDEAANEARSGGEEIILDQNVIAEGKKFCRMAAFAISPDGSKLAYSLDPDGSEKCITYIRNLETGENYPETFENTYGNVYEHNGLEWAADSETFYYLTLDAAQRPYRLWRHRLGSDPSEDPMLCEESDETFFLYLVKTRSGKYILSYHTSTTTREMRFVPADDNDAALKIIQPRNRGHEYFVEHHGDSFLILTNDGARNFRLMRTPVGAPGMENWVEVLPNREDTLIEAVYPFRDFLVLEERRGGLKQLRISAPDGVRNVRYVSFPEPAYTLTPAHNPEYDSGKFRFEYTSLVTPLSVIDYEVDRGEWVCVKEQIIPSGYQKDRFVSERIFVTAADGAQVPVSIVYRKDLKRDGNNPCLLHSYGSYGASMEPEFNSNRLCLLERGFVYAMAHIRGGSEMGRQWYEDGKMMNKRNTFTDFIACAEHLIREKFTSPEKLAIYGVSAGGLLVGACMTMRPDLFGAVIAKVPFVDVVNTMSDPTIPLTTLEYDQWGNPDNRAYFDYMMSYSPYDNIRAADYPHLLITTGLNDPRVAYWEPAKFAAKLREMKTDDHLLLLRTNYEAGHAGSSGRYDLMKDFAFEYAFLVDRLGGRPD